MRNHYLGLIPFQQALRVQQEAWTSCYHSRSGIILGFETEKTITLGIRSKPEDVLASDVSLKNDGYEVIQLDRGGQATLHNPGQLVIFPIVNIRDLGVRSFICHLLKTTVKCLSHFGLETKWDESNPGVFSQLGKVASLGVRIRHGVSSHGVAINISNRLEDFQAIRACGRDSAFLDKLGDRASLPEVFQVWNELY